MSSWGFWRCQNLATSRRASDLNILFVYRMFGRFKLLSTITTSMEFNQKSAGLLHLPLLKTGPKMSIFKINTWRMNSWSGILEYSLCIWYWGLNFVITAFKTTQISLGRMWKTKSMTMNYTHLCLMPWELTFRIV